jgi:TolB-like protein/tetratricopeptide (TPR) repeat protein
MTVDSLFTELRQRKVVQVAAIYGALAWGVTEVLVTVVEQLFLPQWVSTLVVIFFVVGFPVAMFLAWTFDITPEGIRRTTVTSGRGTASIAASLVLLIAGTAGLFYLIKPSLQEREVASRPVTIVPNSVAVLPFENAGGNREDSYLVSGLSDELRDQLARVSGLRIAARSSSIAAAEQGLGALVISETLGVANLVEGTVRRQGNVLKISVFLIQGSSGMAQWSETFERGPRELLNVQQAIAEAVIANVLPDSDVVVTEPATRDPTANELMLLARYHEQQVRERQVADEKTLTEAIRLYRQATEADPESTLAHSRLAGALVYLGDLEAAEAPIFKALSIDPNLSEVQNTLGLYHWARGLLKQARAAWARAVELNPNNPEALQNYARSRWYLIDFEGVEEMLRRAVELDPLNLEPYGTLGSFLAIENNHAEDAREVVSEVEELFEGAAAYRVIGQILAYLGDVDKSIAWTIRARNLEPDNRAHVDKLAEYFADIGDFDTALALDPNGIGILFKARRYQEMIPLAEFTLIDKPDDFRLRSILAIAHNAVGRFETAIHILKMARLPEFVNDGFRNGAEWDGFMALMNAYYGVGDVELARELAQFSWDYTSRFGRDYASSTEYDWWWNILGACQVAILGQDDLVRKMLERTQLGAHLPWDPVLIDSPCFGRFGDDPIYRATVRQFENRRTMLRERLPATLAKFGVVLHPVTVEMSSDP